MDYLRTLGTAAVSSIVQKSGLNLPFSLGRKFPPLDALSIWTLYDATKRVYTSRSTLAPVLIPIQDDATLVSVFEFNSQQKRNLLPSLLPVAQNAVRRLRVTRHPDILKFMDVVEADDTIYIMTERVKPLSEELLSWEAKPVKDRQDWLLWGLHRITVCTRVHLNARYDRMGTCAALSLEIASCLY
jgi:SCY1-like protein 1